MPTLSSFAHSLLRRTSLRSNLAANYAGRVWEMAMSVLFVPLYIAHLGLEAYGVIGTVAVIQAFMLILDFGMTPTLTREAARFEAGGHDALQFKDMLRSIEVVLAVISAIIFAIIALAAPFVATRWMRAGSLDPHLVEISLTIAGGLVALRLLESVYRGTLYGLQRQLLCNGLAAVLATLRGGGAVLLLIFFHADLRGFFGWQAAVSLLSVIAMRTSVGMALPAGARRPRFSHAALSDVWRFATGMLLISLLSLAATQVDKIVLLRMVPLAAFGSYTFAVNICLLLELAVTPMMTALQPRIVGLVTHRDEIGLRRFFRRWVRIVAAVTAPTAALLIFLGPTLILVWSGNRQLAATSGALVSVIAIGTFLHAQCVLPYYVQLGYGWTRLGIWLNVLALGITGPALVIFAPRFGVWAGAWVWVAVTALYAVVGMSVMFRRYLSTERWRFFLIDVGPPALAGFGAMAICIRLLANLPDTTWAHLVTLTIAGGASFFASAGVAFLIDRWESGSPAAS